MLWCIIENLRFLLAALLASYSLYIFINLYAFLLNLTLLANTTK